MKPLGSGSVVCVTRKLIGVADRAGRGLWVDLQEAGGRVVDVQLRRIEVDPADEQAVIDRIDLQAAHKVSPSRR